MTCIRSLWLMVGEQSVWLEEIYIRLVWQDVDSSFRQSSYVGSLIDAPK